jgi:hypothetical protein
MTRRRVPPTGDRRPTVDRLGLMSATVALAVLLVVSTVNLVLR